MSYLDICIIGWNLNALMFVVNFLMAIVVIKNQDPTSLQKESEVLKELKYELDKHYPYRAYTVVITYIVPFTAFFRMSARIIEMQFFFMKNRQAKMFDYMVYKYMSDINKAKNSQ